MLKAQFARERLDGYAMAVGIEFVKIKVKHPYRNLTENQPTLTLALTLVKWAFYLMIYKPAKLKFNRAERRANHLK